MNHPQPEELIEFHCAECAPERAAEIERHLASCADCRAQLDSWRDVRRQLRSWSVTDRPHSAPSPAPATRAWAVLRVAAAAAILLFAGYSLHRWTAPGPNVDLNAVRAAVAQELRAELRAELQRFSADQARHQDQYQQALLRTLGELEARRLADYAGLRRDVETLAVRAEDEFLSTREGLATLAARAPNSARTAP